MDKELFDDLTTSIKEAGRIMKDEAVASRRFVVTGPDVKALRENSGLSQVDFAHLMRVCVKTLQNWEQSGSRPTGPAAALLRVFERAPEETMRALQG